MIAPSRGMAGTHYSLRFPDCFPACLRFNLPNLCSHGSVKRFGLVRMESVLEIAVAFA